jgi:hypothetical protein
VFGRDFPFDNTITSPSFPSLHPYRQPVLAWFHKPLPKQGLGHGFEGFVLAVEQVDFVVEAEEDRGNGALFGERGEEDVEVFKHSFG